MISVSNSYKKAMKKKLRDRSYISINVGIINQEAQDSATINSNLSYWSKGDVFSDSKKNIEYATLEKDTFKLDESMYFMPENTSNIQLLNNGISTKDFMYPIRIDFKNVLDLKGITINFGTYYPTEFTIQTKDNTFTYSNDSSNFITEDVFGITDYIIITPIAMIGGNKRFRINNILFGVGLNYNNNNTSDFSISEYVSSISQELPSTSLSFSFYDEDEKFNVDDDNSFINYLETMQKINVYFGVTLDDSSIEWYEISTLYISDWKSDNGVVSINATDRLTQMEDEYTLGNRIYDRTAYAEAESILKDAGLEPDEYYIDEYLNDITLHNPMPEGTHKECLQLLANACRCIIKQDVSGRIVIRSNFGFALSPSDINISDNGHTSWSKPSNINIGSDYLYGDLTLNFLKTDGNMYFLPEGASYLETSYVSEQIADENGLFQENPQLTISMPASYTYFGVNLKFDGSTPKEMTIRTYKNDILISENKYKDFGQDDYFNTEFFDFDKMTFEFTKTNPYNRVLVNKISFGDVSEYVLTKQDMMSKPVGYKDKKVKNVKCKIYTYTTDEEGNPKEVEDNVFFTKQINEVGETKTIQNPLISTQEHAELLCNWIGNYYYDNVYYDVDYRGDIRNNASDIIHMDSDILNNLQVEIQSHTLNFNGAFSGSMELKRVSRT